MRAQEPGLLALSSPPAGQLSAGAQGSIIKASIAGRVLALKVIRGSVAPECVQAEEDAVREHGHALSGQPVLSALLPQRGAWGQPSCVEESAGERWHDPKLSTG